MNKEDKKLLLIDLCGRLPYGVKVCVYEESAEPETLWDIHTNALNPYLSTDKWMMVYPENVKPYLRPMSSMTEDEKVEYNRAADRDLNRMAVKVGKKLQGNEKLDETLTPYYEHIDWLNEHHFDYRGLIEKGLALEAPDGMYKI